MSNISLHDYFSTLGKKGQKMQAKRHKRADFVRWGKLGGRPRKKQLSTPPLAKGSG